MADITSRFLFPPTEPDPTPVPEPDPTALIRRLIPDPDACPRCGGPTTIRPERSPRPICSSWRCGWELPPDPCPRCGGPTKDVHVGMYGPRPWCIDRLGCGWRQPDDPKTGKVLAP